MLTGAQVVVRSLVAHGVDTVFGIPGTHNLEIYRELANSGIRHVTVRHEQGAGYAADGYARATGRPGVAVTTSGPGVLNIASAVAQSYSDSVPILVLAPGPPLRRGRQDGTLHAMRDQLGAMASITQWALRPDNHGELAATVAKAFQAMTRDRPRPAYLEIPWDLLASTAPATVMASTVPATPPGAVAASAISIVEKDVDADLSYMDDVVELLRGAARPVLLAGGGARRAAGYVRQLAQRLGMAVLTTANGKGCLPEDHPQAVTSALHLPAARALVQQCDVVIAVGTELAETDWWDGFPSPQCLVRIDVDAHSLAVDDLAQVRVRADAAVALASLLGRLPDIRVDCGWVDGWRQQARAQSRREGRRWVSVLDAVAAVLPREAVVVADNAMVSYYGALGSFNAYHPNGFCFPTGFGTLGYALPAAIGAKIADPGQVVVALVGDGGLMFSVQELATAAQEGLSLPVLVFANRGYGEIRAEMRDAGIEPFAVDVAMPECVKLAEAMGGYGVACGRDERMVAAELRRALDRPAPSLIVVDEPQ